MTFSSGYYIHETENRESEFVEYNYVKLSSGSWSNNHTYAYNADLRKAEGAVENVEFGMNYIQQSGSDHLVGSWWNEVYKRSIW